MGMNALEVRRRVMMAQPHEAVAVGAVASFRTDVLSPLKMSFDLLPIQTGEGDPSPENVRPITGHDGFTRTRTVKNIWGGDALRDSILTSMPNSTDYPTNRVISFLASATVVQPLMTDSGLLGRFKENTQYTLILTGYNSGSSTKTTNLRFNYTDGTATNIDFNSTDATKQTTVAVTTANKTLYSISKRNSSNRTYVYYDESGLFEGVLTASEFESYKGTSIPTTFPDPPGTVYGCHVTDNGDGTYDLSVNYYMVKAVSPSSFGAHSATISAPVTASGYTLATNPFYCNRFKPSNYSASNDNHVHFANANLITFRLSEEVGTTRGEWETWFENNPTYVCYKIATPVQYTGLSLTALQSLIGQNHIWVDNADSVSVEYWGH